MVAIMPAPADRVPAKFRANGTIFDHGKFDRQAAGTQGNGELVGGLHGEAAADLRIAAQDRFVDIGRGKHLTVKKDCEGPADIFLRHPPELAPANTVKCKVDRYLSGTLVKTLLRIGKLIP